MSRREFECAKVVSKKGKQIYLNFLFNRRVLHKGRKTGLVVSGLDSRSEGCGLKSCLVLYKILDGNGLKAMPGSISAPNSGSFMEK